MAIWHMPIDFQNIWFRLYVHFIDRLLSSAFHVATKGGSASPAEMCEADRSASSKCGTQVRHHMYIIMLLYIPYIYVAI